MIAFGSRTPREFPIRTNLPLKPLDSATRGETFRGASFAVGRFGGDFVFMGTL